MLYYNQRAAASSAANTGGGYRGSKLCTAYCPLIIQENGRNYKAKKEKSPRRSGHGQYPQEDRPSGRPGIFVLGSKGNSRR